MKKLVVLLFVASALLVLGASFSTASEQDFILINDTGVDIHALFVTPTKSDDWGDNILGKDMLADGGTATIHFAPQVESCVWDFAVSDPDDTAVAWSGIDLCKAEKVTLHMDGDKVWATVE